MSKYKQGEFIPTNTEKFCGQHNPFYRSGWEQKFMVLLDTTPTITKWCSECVAIKYWDKANNKPRKYFTDFYIEFEDGRRMIIEIKPYKELQKPIQKQLKTQKQKMQYLNEMKTYITNISKWQAADAFCKANGIEFKIATENNFNFF